MKSLLPVVLSLFVVAFSTTSAAQTGSGTPEDTPPETPAAAEGTAPANASEAAPDGGAENNTQPEGVSTPVAAADLKTADQAYQLKVRQIESDINELKERIFRSKAKLTLLTEQVTGGAGTGANAVITHKWQMGSAFRIAEVYYYLDGAPIWQEIEGENSDKLTQIKTKRIQDGPIVEGSHTLSVKLIIKGNGSGVFNYVDGFKWNIQKKYTFTAEPGRVHTIDVVFFEKGNFTTDIRDRPAVRFEAATQVDKAESDAGQNKKSNP